TIPAQQPKLPMVAPTTARPAAAMPKVAADDAEPPPAVVTEPVAAPIRAPQRDPNRPVIAELRRQGDNLRLFFPFAAPTPAAVFQRADTLWLVFDTKAVLDVGVLSNDQSKTIRSAAVAREDDAQVVRLKLERPRLVSGEPQESGALVPVARGTASC